ncbi:MAG: sulfatase [Acidimicrobiia bacterium]|nr:sulfatase [Acidimicrobiia bacterium]
MTNVVLFTVDDMNGDTPGCFGGHPEATPTIDAFAAQGRRFTRGHVTIAVCQPSRSVMMTGRYPHRSGAMGFMPIADGVPVLTDVLGEAGYRCGIIGKVTHVAPVERMGWHLAVDQEELGEGRDPSRYAAVVGAFVADAVQAGRPFFLMANAHDPHRPFHASDQEADHFSPQQLDTIPEPSHVFGASEWPVPGFLPDLPEIRREVAEYLSSSRRADDVFAAVLAELEAAGVADDTLVIFLSDNGMAFPFAKTNCYLQSTRTPWIVRWPGRVPAGTVDDRHFVEAIDLAPTILDAVGLGVPDGVDGRSHLALLDGDTQAGRDRIVTVFHEAAAAAWLRHHGDDPSPAQFEMRSLQDARWGYIWNAWADGTKQFFNESQSGRTWAAMADAAIDDRAVAARTRFFQYRQPEELYDLADDPDALCNLIDADEHAAVRAELRHHLLQWMRRTDDFLLDRFATEVIGVGRNQ